MPKSASTSSSIGTHDQDSVQKYTWILVAILILAAGLRLWGLPRDLPFSYFGDEVHLMKRSMSLGTGDLNPHWFNKPGFLMYILLGCYGLYFVAGRAVGRFESTDEFAAHFLTDSGSFLLIGRSLVLLTGVALVYTIYLIGKRGLNCQKAGLIGSLVAAVLPSLVIASQTIKADAPCALFIAISVFIFMRAKDEDSVKGLIFCALAAGAAMGTKYCGIILVPAYVTWEVASALRGKRRWPKTLLRASVLIVVFVLGFFITSPYNFLDPTWANSLWDQVRAGLGFTASTSAFNPDSKTIYDTGMSSWPKATVHFFQALRQTSIGGSLMLLTLALGTSLGLMSSKSRSYSLFALLVFSIFLVFAVVLFPFHVGSRHLSVMVPLMAPLVGYGLARVAKLIPVSDRARAIVLAVLALAISIPSLAITMRFNRQITRLDSRTEAHNWIVQNLSPPSRILVEDEGPELNPNRVAVERMQSDLSSLDPGPFTRHQEQRLDLLYRYPSADGLNIDRLGHPWWLTKEVSAEELRSSEFHARVGNPLVNRIPMSLDEYRRAGVEYVVSNSKARRLMGNRPNFRESFPSFFSFYEELEAAAVVKEFDPDHWNGKGPQIWIYDIRDREQSHPSTGVAQGF